MREKIAKFTLCLLLVVAVIGGLVRPYLRNRNLDKVNPAENRVAIPDFVFYDGDENRVSFSDFAGKPVVLNIWASWCTYCVQEMPDFDMLYSEYGDKVNFIFLDAVGVNGETKRMADKFMSDNGYNLPVYYDTDGRGVYVFGISSYPTTVYADRQGNLFYAVLGMTNYDSAQQVIEEMLGE